MPRLKKYPDELMDRGVRLALESKRPIAHVAVDLGIHPEALRKRVRRAQADNGTRPDMLSTEEREEIRKLRRGCPSCAARTRSSKAFRCFLPRSSTRTERGERVCRWAS
jgi:transposase